MMRRRFALLCLSSVVAACDCGGLGLDQKRFACRDDADCLEGSVCIDRGSGLECVRRDAPTGGGSATGGGNVAGGVAGGGSTAGGVAGGDAGGAAGGDAGGASGGSTAGGDAGGAAGGDAGGASGGSTAGGASGGSTAGGASGGSTAGGSGGGSTAGGAGGGSAAGGAAGGSAGGAAAGGSAGGSVGPPTQLVFTTSPRSQQIATCSFSITIETRDAMGRPSPVTAPTTVALSVGAAMGITLHLANTCTSTPSTSVLIATGTSSTTFYARGTTPVNAMLTASANGLGSAVQSLTFVDGPDTLVFTSPAPSPLRAGLCFPLSYQARRAGVAFAVASNTTVSFVSTPAGSARFYSDATCSSPTTAQVLTAGTTTDSVFVRVLTGSAPVTLQAQAALMAPASLTVTALPMVRRGNCAFNSPAWTLIDGGSGTLVDGGPVADTFAFCGLNPQPTSRDATMMIFQATSSGAYQDAMVRCRLPAGGDLTCSRRAGGSSANVHWQIVEIPSGLRVVHTGSSSCPASLTLSAAVDPSKTFLLRSISNTSNSYDDEDAPVFTLAGPTSVTLSKPGCEGIELQAVEWTGVAVSRGALDGGMDAGVALASVMLTPGAPPQRTALLTQSGTDINGVMRTCSMMARGFMPGPSEVRFSRGLGDAGCATEVADFIAHERLDFGSLATVQERTLTFLPGQTTQSPVITSVDTTRTFVFASNQSAMGQGMGETNMPLTSLPAEAAFSLELPATPTATTVTVRRVLSSSTAVVTLYIVQVE